LDLDFNEQERKDRHDIKYFLRIDDPVKNEELNP